jgi:uncharacterized membrane protein YfcA
LAGFGGGLSGSVAGLASLVSYPALLAAGLSPVSANVTNTVSLVFSSAGSVWGFRPELKGQGRTVRRLVPFAMAGGAAAGVVLLAVLLVSTVEPLARATALRNLLLGSANAVAAVSFIAWGPVRWSAAVPLSAGFLAGGRLGPIVVRNVPAAPLRVLIACAGLGLAVHLGLDAYR